MIKSSNPTHITMFTATPNQYLTKRNAKATMIIVFTLLCCILTALLTHQIISRSEPSGCRTQSKSDQREHLLGTDGVQTGLDTYSSDEKIHLAIVCGGYGATRSLYVLLKSILFHRTSPIHLHLFVDSVARQILVELFSSWLVEDFQVTYYNLTNYEKRVSWITNSHYSHRYGLLKLELMSAFDHDENIKKIIILDTDMLILGDIKYAWREFKKFPRSSNGKTNPFLGMVENQSDWYLGGPSKLRAFAWPALGRGYNSGTILVDLERLRQLKWESVWRSETEDQLISQLSTTLADQDILNALIKHRPWLVYRLPCSMNIQLNDNSHIEDSCANQSTKLQIIHWNSPRKLDTTNPYARIFNDWYINFRNWDAKLLEKPRPFSIEKIRKMATSSNKRVARRYCDNMRPNSSDRLRVYPFFMEFDFEPTQYDITYVVHLTIDRRQILDELADSWKGPISAAIYLPEQETDLLMSFIEASASLSKRKNIGLHLAFRDYGSNYPINRMRNIALNHSVTPYVFLCDIDFLPPSGLYDHLQQNIYIIERKTGKMSNKAIVVPAFESKEYKFSFPQNKSDLLIQLNESEVKEFREQIWPKGHMQTDYGRWKSSSAIYEVEWDKDYEPFIVTTKEVPRFDERFIGFGWNKVQHITYLAALGYKFLVLPEAFVIHKFHSPSFDLTMYRESQDYKTCIQGLKLTFLRELRNEFPEFVDRTYNQYDDYNRRKKSIDAINHNLS